MPKIPHIPNKLRRDPKTGETEAEKTRKENVKKLMDPKRPVEKPLEED